MKRAEQVKLAFPHLTEEQHKQVIALIAGKLDPDSFESVQQWVRQCYNEPSNKEKVMCALNEVIGGFGVEYIAATDDSYTDAQGLDYVNMGDTYTATVIYDNAADKFKICSWGDIVEKYPNRYE